MDALTTHFCIKCSFNKLFFLITVFPKAKQNTLFVLLNAQNKLTDSDNIQCSKASMCLLNVVWLVYDMLCIRTGIIQTSVLIICHCALYFIYIFTDICCGVEILKAYASFSWLCTESSVLLMKQLLYNFYRAKFCVLRGVITIRFLCAQRLVLN